MFQINDNFQKLPGSYLFSTIAKKVAAYQEANPDKEIIRLGIGDVTQPLAPAIIDALHKAVDEMGNAAGTGTSAVTQPLENLKTLIIAVIGAVGVIILAKNVMEFAQAYQQQDSSTMNSALKGIVAGVMMAGISTVLTFLGF